MGFTQEALGQWLSNLSVLENDPKILLRAVESRFWSQIFRYILWVLAGPRHLHFNRFPIDLDTVVSRLPFKKYCLRSWWPSSRLSVQGSVSPGRFRFPRPRVWGQMRTRAVKGSQHLCCPAPLFVFFFFYLF